MKKFPLLVLAIILLCCSSCSALRVSYDHADLLLKYRINDYTSFNAQQKEDIRREVDAYLQWHRKNALPEYIAFLKEIQRLLQRNVPLEAGDVTRMRGEYDRLHRKTIAPAIRPAARILSTLDLRQIEELGKAYARKNRKQKNERFFASEQKNLAMRAERNIELVERLVGNLSGKQRRIIMETSMHMPFVAKDYMEFREVNQARLLALLKENGGEDKIAELLRSWLNTPEAIRTPQQQQAIQSYENAMDEMTAQIYGLLTDRQKAHLREKIATYIGDLQYLSEEKAAASALPAPRCAGCTNMAARGK